MSAILVQSHRGGGALAPENTLDSFAATWAMGAVPEADLRTTRDGVIVAFHDENFARVVKEADSELRAKGVGDVTWQDLAALDVGSWRSDRFAGQRVASAAEIFAAMRGDSERRLYMDIKDVRLPQLADLARQYDVADQVICTAPDEHLLREWRTLVPGGQTLLWMGIIWGGDENSLRQRLTHLRGEAFAGITQLQIHAEATRSGAGWEFKPSLDLFRWAASQLKPFGILFQSIPWECADAEVYRLLLESGVQSFASDYPEVALRVLREWADNRSNCR